MATKGIVTEALYARQLIPYLNVSGEGIKSMRKLIARDN